MPVRRFFIFGEESVEKATQRVVFEPNDGCTWGKAGGRVEDFLVLQWREGALQGTTPEEASCVRADG